MTEYDELKARLAELDAQIDEYPHWGAALTAWDEERQAILRALKRIGDGESKPD